MIFHQHKCIFFHVPKTAGYSIERFLDCEKKRDARKYHPDVIFGIDDGVYTQHFNLDLIKDRVERNILDKYFKFCFVRNTYDRLVSAFCYSPIYPKNKDTFKQNLKIIKNNINYLHITNHFNTQLNYVLDENDNVVVDFIGRYENLHEDMQKVCDKINIEYRFLPKSNQSKRSKYQNYYDDESIELVNDIYKKEIKYFNFEYSYDT